MKVNKFKNKRKKVLILLLICIVVVVILMILLQQLKKKKEHEESIKDFLEFRQEYESQTILPRNIYELYNYSGDYDRDYLYKNMKVFVDYLDYLKNNLNESDIDKFYLEHNKEILEVLGIDNQDEFTVFMKNVKSKNVKENEFKYAEIERGSSYNRYGYYNFVLYLYYGDNNELVKFDVAFAKSKELDIKVAYRFVEE